MNRSNSNHWIPEGFVEKLRDGHARGHQLLTGDSVHSDSIESVEVAEMVEAHRWAWKPKQVRVLLVAESHVHTQAAEFAFDYGHALHFPTNLNIPSRYVRLIYCLGYGEKLLAPGFDGGTPQFWGIFGKICGTSPRHQHGAPRHERLKEKIRTLQVLAELGVWLVDASFHAVSLRQGQRLNPELVRELQRLWWKDYGRSIIDAERPEFTVAVGKGVYSSMREYVQFDEWVYQPQGVRGPLQQQHNDAVLQKLRSKLQQKESGKMS